MIGKGEVFGIVGESGSGKSVATKNILRLGPKNMKVKSGEILFKDKDILKLSMKELQNLRGSEISMVFQSFWIRPTTSSTYSWGVTPFCSAIFWIFCPCSSVPVRNRTS